MQWRWAVTRWHPCLALSINHSGTILIKSTLWLLNEWLTSIWANIRVTVTANAMSWVWGKHMYQILSWLQCWHINISFISNYVTLLKSGFQNKSPSEKDSSIMQPNSFYFYIVQFVFHTLSDAVWILTLSHCQ